MLRTKNGLFCIGEFLVATVVAAFVNKFFRDRKIFLRDARATQELVTFTVPRFTGKQIDGVIKNRLDYSETLAHGFG